MKLDRNGYGPSLFPEKEWCLICGRRDRPLQRHEVFHGPFRQKSKAYGCWVLICDYCHANKMHGDAVAELAVKRMTQKRVMEAQGWTVADFIREFGKNYLEV